MKADDLRAIKSFPSLVKYLRHELSWPIETEDFDDLTFDYSPEELGLDAKTAAKVKEIKQLRPLPGAKNQPWGIFFINFEPKRLPVVALRRILGHLVLRKRVSANKSERPAWNLHDLLFISSYGESEHRDIAFAHFADDPTDKSDLPVLRVLGWDDEDTVLHLDNANKMLSEKLRWPAHPDEVALWQANWSAAFVLKHNYVVKTSKELSIQMAHLATRIRKRVNKALAVETESGPLRTLMRAFREALIHDLVEDDFADMYAQTITYGLLSARVSRPAALIAENVVDMVPITNPFLRDLLSTFLTIGGRKGKIDFDELGINDVVQALREVDMEAVLRDFGDRNPQEDPVIHFYELFLKEYDAKKRMQRGVFYTPRPVVSYIVRSVHELLQTEFGLADGLADTATWADMLKRNKSLSLPEIEVVDPKSRKVSKQPIDPQTPFVQILDPATGTATFLVEVIDIIYKTMSAKWTKEGHGGLWLDKKWNEYVPKHLLPRLHGYELMMAPYAIAHMKIGLKLFETGYKFGSGERARIYLTNALEPPQDFSDTFEQMAPALAHEAQAVNDVKRRQRFTVVMGNPPYSKSSQNQGKWIETLMEEYKRTVRSAETQIQALSDDYAKFLRLAHFTLQQSGKGILGFITNNSYFDGPLFRDMRGSMLTFFEGLRFLNLHGDSRKQFSPPDGAADENVFDIQQGVALTLLSRKNGGSTEPQVSYADLWGTREERYATLLRTTAVRGSVERLQPTPPLYLFIAVEKELEAEFHAFWHLYDVFGTGNKAADNHESYGAGFVTQQDGFAVGFASTEIAENVREFVDGRANVEALWAKFQFCSTNQWNFERARTELKRLDVSRATKRCLYRPFDYRFTVFDRNICTIVRSRITSQFDGSNVALLTTRRVTRLPFNNIFVANLPAEYKVASHDRNTIVFPLWISDEANSGERVVGTRRHLNFNPAFTQALTREFPAIIEPRRVFDYIYAVVHSPLYRRRYGEFLKIDFPRIPLPIAPKLFDRLSKLGDDLVAAHLMESARLEKYITTYTGSSTPEVGKVSYDAGTVWLDKAQTIGFAGVPETVWNFHIGGYQVCEKWLKDRKGRRLTKDDIAHYQKIVVALSETIRLMKEIDETIEKHGGWPGAFVTVPAKLA